MEKGPFTISDRKFANLGSRAQHKLLADLADMAALEPTDLSFHERYEHLYGLVELDRFHPPSWLSLEEVWTEIHRFHQLHGGVQDLAESSDLSWEPKHRVHVVVDGVRSPYNIGSILRLIDNFGLAGLVHTSPHLSLEHAQLKKAARGCEAWIPVSFQPDLTAWLKADRRPVIGIEADEKATPLNLWRPPSECILILGNETYGIAQEIRHQCDALVAIPLAGFKKSMNVSHAFAVIAQRMVENHA